MLSLLFIKMIIKLLGNTYILKIQNSDFIKILSDESKMELEDLILGSKIFLIEV